MSRIFKVLPLFCWLLVCGCSGSSGSQVSPIDASSGAPDASAAIHEIVLAVQARVPIPMLATMMHAFPSTSRAFDGLYADAVRQLRMEPQAAPI